MCAVLELTEFPSFEADRAVSGIPGAYRKKCKTREEAELHIGLTPAPPAPPAPPASLVPPASTSHAHSAPDQLPATQDPVNTPAALPQLPHANIATPARTLPQGYDLAPSQAVTEDTISDGGDSYAVNLVFSKTSIETGLDLRMRMDMAVRNISSYSVSLLTSGKTSGYHVLPSRARWAC